MITGRKTGISFQPSVIRLTARPLSILCFLAREWLIVHCREHFYNNENVEHYDYNPEKAKEILEAAGCTRNSDGFYEKGTAKKSVLSSA